MDRSRSPPDPSSLGTSTLALEDLVDRIVLRPAPDDPIAAARGAIAGKLTICSEQLRHAARQDETAAEGRRANR